MRWEGQLEAHPGRGCAVRETCRVPREMVLCVLVKFPRELVLIWGWVSEGSADSLKFSASFGVSVQLSGE